MNGEKTGRTPTFFKIFLERFHQLSREGGRVAVLMPAGVYALEGVTGLRQLLFSQARIEAIYSFENAFERFFPTVDSRTKFLTLVFEKRQTVEQSFPAVFMLRNEEFGCAGETTGIKSEHITSDFFGSRTPLSFRSSNCGTTKNADSLNASTAPYQRYRRSSTRWDRGT